MFLIAAWSSARLDSSLPLVLCSSSSLEFCTESGGERTAPDGIDASSVTGGGDCRRLFVALILFESFSALSAVPGGVGSELVGLVVNDAVLIEGVRRWRVR